MSGTRNMGEWCVGSNTAPPESWGDDRRGVCPHCNRWVGMIGNTNSVPRMSKHRRSTRSRESRSLIAEVERLERWKAEAIDVLGKWDHVAETCDDDQRLGEPRSEGVARAIERLSAIVDRIPADRLNEWHTVTVHATGWHMAHPIDCVLVDCAFDGLAQAEWVEPPHAEGVWRWHNFDDEPWEWQEDDAPPHGGNTP